MSVNNIHIWQIQSLQRQVHALDYVLSGQTVVIEGFGGVGGICLAPIDLAMLVSRWRKSLLKMRVAYLGRNDQVILLPAKLLNGFSQNDLGLSAGVDLGSVEKVDAGIVGSLNAVEGGF